MSQSISTLLERATGKCLEWDKQRVDELRTMILEVKRLAEFKQRQSEQPFASFFDLSKIPTLEIPTNISKSFFVIAMDVNGDCLLDRTFLIKHYSEIIISPEEACRECADEHKKELELQDIALKTLAQTAKPDDFRAIGVDYVTSCFTDDSMEFLTTFTFKGSKNFHEVKCENIEDIYSNILAYKRKMKNEQ